MKALALVLALAACGGKSGGGGDEPPANGKKDGGVASVPGDAVELPPAPPLPKVPPGLPDPPERPEITPNLVALGDAMFGDPTLSSTGKLACVSCHDGLQYGFSGRKDNTATGKPNLRRAPALVNLAWVTAFDWDGRYPTLAEQLPSHIRGQLGAEPTAIVDKLSTFPAYRAGFARSGGASADVMIAALAAYVTTRYTPNGRWDRVERSPDAPADLKAGYALFTGKAQCGTCHTPPLYTDNDFHRLGLIAVADEGRGRVDAAKKGAFRTPTLRGAFLRPMFFHDGSAATLEAAIDWHLAGGVGQGADPSIVDVVKVTLTPAERDALIAFVRAL